MNRTLAAQGRFFVYRVFRPEQATLSITRGPDRAWHTRELKAARNHAVARATRVAIQVWLDARRVSI